MPDSNIPITAGAGTPVDTRTQADGEHRQVMVTGDATSTATQKVNASGDAVVSLTHPSVAALGISAGVTGYGNLRVTGEASGLFHDSFDSTAGLNTTDRWSAAGSAIPTIVTGAVILNANGTASASSSLISKPTFGSLGVNFLGVAWTGRFENNGAAVGTAFSTGAHRFMGVGMAPTTWNANYAAGNTTNNTLLHGIGFEIDTDGLMYPVVYDNGTRTKVNLTATQAPGNLNTARALANGETHQFLIVLRADAIFWYVDGTNAPVAIYNYSTAGYSFPDVGTIPLRFAHINTATVVGASPITRIGAVGVGDTGSNNTNISDADAPWRRAKVVHPAEQFVGAAWGGSQGSALNVNINSIQKNTFYATIVNVTSGALTANTAKSIMVLEHSAAAARTVRIRRVIVSAMQTTALAGTDSITITRHTALSTAGTTNTPQPAVTGGTALETTVKTMPTITAGTLLMGLTAGVTAATANTGFAGTTIYDWAEGGETIPLTIRPGQLEGFSINALSSAAKNYNMSVTVIFSEE